MNKTKGVSGSRKKPPERRCVGCREMKNKAELMRIVRNADDSGFAIDTTGKSAGRGAYICKNAECFKKAAKSGGFDRSFKQKIPREIYAILEGMILDE
ncbi:MAG: YlxR family protein [Defluviitaleaceae bacterium]|nr:YlxR family protein [Defluviitaleaceae bacterium]